MVSERSEDKQEPGNPLDYAYGDLTWHHYWAIVESGWQVCRRIADKNHPGNSIVEVSTHPPEGVERWIPESHDQLDS